MPSRFPRLEIAAVVAAMVGALATLAILAVIVVPRVAPRPPLPELTAAQHPVADAQTLRCPYDPSPTGTMTAGSLSVQMPATWASMPSTGNWLICGEAAGRLLDPDLPWWSVVQLGIGKEVPVGTTPEQYAAIIWDRNVQQNYRQPTVTSKSGERSDLGGYPGWRMHGTVLNGRGGRTGIVDLQVVQHPVAGWTVMLTAADADDKASQDAIAGVWQSLRVVR